MGATWRCIAAVVICGSLALAQFTTARMSGLVSDTSGASVPNATVTLRNLETGLVQNAQTGGDGTYVFPRVPAGVYELRVEKAGFGVYVQTGIRLNVDQSATQDVRLSVGSVAEQVSVTADAERVTTSTATVTEAITERQILNLPVEGRTVQSLVFLTPGTVDVTNNYCGFGCQGGVYPGEQYASVHGGGPNGVNYQLDGGSHNDTYLNMNLPFPNPDAVQEFSLQTSSMSAEYGNAVSGVVNIVTKSGTNQLHGSLFDYLRNGSLNARNFFAPEHDQLKRNQFGGSLGGPILKSRLFYFGSYQGTRTRIAPEGQIAFVPTDLERSGDYSQSGVTIVDPLTGEPFAGNRIPQDRISPAATRLLGSLPLPNGPGRQVTYAGASTIQDEDQYLIKVDYTRGRQMLAGRWFWTQFRHPAVAPAAGNILQATPNGSEVTVRNLAVNHTFTATPRLIFNSWFSWNEQAGGTRSSAPFGFPDLGVRIAAPKSPELVMLVNGYFYLNTYHFGDNTRGDWSARESVTAVLGGHELHFGGEAMRVRAPQKNTYLQSGEFSFTQELSGDNMADVLLGRVSTFTQGGGIYLDLVGTKWAGFVQDNWKVTPRLTVNAGLRWDPYFPFRERKGRTTCFAPGLQSKRYPNAPKGLLYGGPEADPGCPSNSFDAHPWNFAPRLGFAWRVTNDGKTSLRAGAGTYYMPPETVTYQDVAGVAPFGPILTLNDVSFDDPYTSAGIPNPFPEQYGPRVPGPDARPALPVTIYGTFPRDFKIPRIHMWNLTLERDLGSGIVARAAYYGNRGIHLFGSTDQKPLHQANPAVYIPGESTLENTQERRLYPDFGLVGLIDSWNNSNYHAFELSAERRFLRGLQITASYTFSRGMDDFGQSGNFSQTNPFSRRFDYGRSDDDIPHSFKISGIWEVPHVNAGRLGGALVNGWQVNPIVNWRSGFPFTVVSGLENSFSGAGWGPQDRADFLGGAVRTGAGTHQQMIAQYFDTSRFVPNAIGTFGNAGKNILRGPRWFKADLGVSRSFRVRESVRLDLRAEAFDLLNNVNFGGPDGNVSNDSFGQITWAYDPRIFQFALKLVF